MHDFITVAPARYAGTEAADFRCSGTHDEEMIQAAIDQCIRQNKNVILLNGVYHIDGFHDYYHDGGPCTAICFPNAWREIRFLGQNHEYGYQKRCDNGVVLRVSAQALALASNETDVIRSRWTKAGIPKRVVRANRKRVRRISQ